MKIVRFNPPFTGIQLVSIIPRIIGVRAITVFPFILFVNAYLKENRLLRNQEIIQLHQQMECGLAGTFLYIIVCWFIGWPFLWVFLLPVPFCFYWIFVISYMILWIRYKNSFVAYESICFVRESVRFCNIYGYYKLRRPFDWMKYIVVKL